LNKTSGFDINSYIKQLQDDKSPFNESEAVTYVSSHIKTCIEFQRRYISRGYFQINFIGSGIYLTLCYLLVKIAYASVIFFQLIILNVWFRDTYHSNLSVFEWLFGSHNWKLAERFPRMILCSFKVYILNDLQVQWVQCTLPINNYIEKIYIAVWLWLWFLLLLNVLDFFRLLFFLKSGSKSYIRAYLDSNQNGNNSTKNLRAYLRWDGLLLLQLIESNTSNYYVICILSSLVKLLKS
jgi:innexin